MCPEFVHSSHNMGPDCAGMFREMFEYAADGILLADQDKKFIYANARAAEILLYSPQELCTMHIQDLIPECDLAEVPLRMDDIRQGKNVVITRTVIRKDTSRIPVEVSAVKFRENNLLAILRDHSEKAAEEHALKQSELKYRELFEQLNDAVFVADPETGILLDVNKSAEKLTGKNREHLIGTHQSALHPPEQKDFYVEKFGSHCKMGNAADYDGVIVHTGGSRIPVRISAAVISIGGQKRVVGIFHDISQQLSDRLQLQKNEKQFRSVLQTAHDAIVTTDRDGTIMFWNRGAEQMYGYPADEMIGFSYLKMVPPRLHDIQKRLLSKNLESMPDGFGVRSVEGVGYRKDGREFPVSLSMSTWSDAGSTFITIIARDITQRKKAEDIERNLEARSRQIIEHAPFPIVMVDEHGNPEYLNPSFKRIIGYSLEDISTVDECFEKFYPDPAYRSKVRAIWQQDILTLKDNHIIYRQYDVMCRDGTVRNVLFRAGYMDNNKIFIMLEDNTERQLAEKKLLASEKKYRDLFEQLNDAVIVTELSSGIIMDVNKKAELQFGYSRAELIGTYHKDLYPPEYREYYKQTFQKQIEQGEGSNIEARVKTKSGDILNVLISCSAQKRGDIPIVIGIFRDITDYRKTLRENEQLAMAADQVREIIIIMEQNGIITYANESAARLMGTSVRGAIGANAFTQANGIFAENIRTVIWRSITEGAVWTGQHTVVEPDGMHKMFESTVSPIRDENSDVVNIVAIGRDVTKEKQMEKEFRHTQKMEAIGTLAGGVAHDFNNILGAIMGFTELSMNSIQDTAALRSNLQYVLSATHRAKDLIRQILTFSRQDEKEMQPYNIAPVIKEAINFLRASMPATIEIRKNIRPDYDVIMAEPTQIYQVLINLSTNAAYAMSEGGGILEVELVNARLDEDEARYHKTRPGDYLKLRVSDTGYGINSAIIDKIFDPYFSTKKAEEGSGLGLSVVHGIVRSHGGIIEVKSRTGEGTSFEIYFPCVDKPVSAQTFQKRTLPTGTEHILIVDDEVSLVEMSKSMLETMGYTVTAFLDPGDALAFVSSDSPKVDLAILDKTMPVMTGIQLAHEIRKINREVPMIMCTGYPDADDPEKIKLAGINEIMLKPVYMHDLAQKVRHLLDAEAQKCTS